MSLFSETNSNVMRCAFIVALGGFVFGYDATVISGAISFIVDDFGLSDWEQGWVVSSPTLGALLAMIIAGELADRFGRRNVLIAVAALYIVSAFFSAIANSFEMLVSARFIGGLAFCSLMLAPMYIAEISEAEHRGKLVSINQFNIVIGLSASYFVNYGLLQAKGALGEDNLWRIMLGVELVPAVLWFVLLWTLPYSPRWLVLKQRHEEAASVMQRLGMQNITEEISAITASVSKIIPPLKERLGHLFHPNLRKALMIGLVVGLTQQLTGINVIFFYAPTIFEQTGIGQNAAFVQAIIIGVTNVLFTIVALWTIDRYGRRPLLITGLSGIIVCLSVCAWAFFQADIEPYSTLILLCIVGFVASFAMSLGPVMWVLFSEIFPNDVRGIAISAVTVINSTASFMVQFIFPWQLSNLGPSFTFLCYVAVAILGLLWILKFLPETKGTKLENN